jgi:Fe-S oxidoreductase
VALFADTYINYHEPQIGKAAIKLLQDCGYDVELAEAGCCQRPKISNGFLRSAKEKGTELANNLKHFADRNMMILVCEPSCTSSLLDDLPDLIEDEVLSSMLQKHVQALDEFIAKAIDSGLILAELCSTSSSVFLHGHCHQKATFGTGGMEKIYRRMKDVSLNFPDTGCCGMAGSFGYEKGHYDISQKIAETELIPAINMQDPDTLIVANGFSCRHQIKDFSTKNPVHWVESIRAIPKS